MINLDSEEAPSPTPMDSTEIFRRNESYTCSECQSEIVILSIDKEKVAITFKCLNRDIKNNHGIKNNIPIGDYIKGMEKINDLYSICSVCKKKQNNEKNIISFKFCINCQAIICNNSSCINNHISHTIINNNQRGIFCLIHPEKKNIAFCSKCKINLCEECLKSRKHINHTKNNLNEIKPSLEDEKIVEDYINYLKEKKQKLENSRKQK